jgi:hypothetical protein
MRINKYNFDKNNYITNIRQKYNHQDKPSNGSYANKRPNSTKYINQPQQRQQYINYDATKDTSSKNKNNQSKRVNSSV